MYLSKRSTKGLSPGIIVIPIIFSLLVIGIAGGIYYRKHWPKSVLYIPKSTSTTSSQTSPTKKSRKWNPFRFFTTGFTDRSKKSPNQVHNDDNESQTSLNPSNDPRNDSTTEMTTTNLNRNSQGSLRSILTLPPYHPSPLATELLIAREGERSGMDTVVTLPETAAEAEARREADQAALYEIRQTRRREADERQERRRARAQAREDRDYARLEELRVEAVQRQRERAERARIEAAEREGEGAGRGGGRNGSSFSLTPLPTTSSLSSAAERRGSGPSLTPFPSSTSSAAGPAESSHSLLADHQTRTDARDRDRRISSVSYADLGLARHDGSRIRGGSVVSVESDHRPLLAGAMGMGGAGSMSLTSLFSQHHQPHLGRHDRAGSVESVLTTDSERTSEGDHHRRGSGSEHLPSSPPPPPPLPPIPMGEPPGYEDALRYEDRDEEEEEAPPYTSPVAARGEVDGSGIGSAVTRLPSLHLQASVPSIEVTGTGTGTTPTPTSGVVVGGAVSPL